MHDDPLRQTIQRLYAELERLEPEHADLTDRDVVEALADTLNLHFVWGEPAPRLPATFFLFSRAGDKALRRLVRDFLDAALPLAQGRGIEPGAARLALLQDDTLTTPGGRRYDHFLGSRIEPPPPRPLPEALYRHPRGRELGWAALVTAALLALGLWLLSRAT